MEKTGAEQASRPKSKAVQILKSKELQSVMKVDKEDALEEGETKKVTEETGAEEASTLKSMEVRSVKRWLRRMPWKKGRQRKQQRNLEKNKQAVQSLRKSKAESTRQSKV